MGIKKLIAIDGNRQHLDGGAMFGHAPKAMWSKWIPVDDKNRIPLATRALLVQTDKKNILFEVGTGAFFDPEMKKRYGIEPEEHILLKNLEELGISENEIDAVVLSHLHFDHAGGLLPAYPQNQNRLHFPNATYYVGKEHFEFSKNPHLRERASFISYLPELLEKSGRLKFIEGKTHPDFDFVEFLVSHGHTIGMLLSKIHLPTGPIVFVTDLIPGMAWVPLPIIMGYDRFAEQKVDEKKALYDSLIKENGKLFFTHDPLTPCALLKQDEKGKFFAEPTTLN